MHQIQEHFGKIQHQHYTPDIFVTISLIILLREKLNNLRRLIYIKFKELEENMNISETSSDHVNHTIIFIDIRE